MLPTRLVASASLGLLVLTLAGCSTSSSDRVVKDAYAAAERFPMSQRPAYYQLLLDNKKLSKSQYAELMQTWEAMNSTRSSEEIAFARMTPTERATAWQKQEAATPPAGITVDPALSPATPTATVHP